MSKIGVFDSGFGGLTVLREIRNVLPQYDYLYLGDSARAPYGQRSREEIYQFTKEAVQYLFRHDCGLIILACNTASAEALRRIQQEYLPPSFPNKRVLGIIIPTAEEVASRNEIKKIGVVATRGTVDSGAYIREIKKVAPDKVVLQEAAPDLVPLIESGVTEGTEIEKKIRQYVKPLMGSHIDCLILGCTHYAIVEDEFRKVLPLNIRIFNQSEAVSQKLDDYLERHPEIEKGLARNGKIEYFCTGSCKKFNELSAKLLGLKVASEQVNLGASE